MATKGQKFNKYEDETLKEKIIEEKILKGRSYSYLSKEYDLPKGTIITWVYQYKQQGKIEKRKKGRPKKEKNIDYKEKYEILKKYMEFLEEVEHEKK